MINIKEFYNKHERKCDDIIVLVGAYGAVALIGFLCFKFLVTDPLPQFTWIQYASIATIFICTSIPILLPELFASIIENISAIAVPILIYIFCACWLIINIDSLEKTDSLKEELTQIKKELVQVKKEQIKANSKE